MLGTLDTRIAARNQGSPTQKGSDAPSNYEAEEISALIEKHTVVIINARRMQNMALAAREETVIIIEPNNVLTCAGY